MKQALNSGKLGIIRSTSPSTSSKTASTGGHTSGLELSGSAQDSGHLSSPTSKLPATKSVNSDQSSTLVALKLAVADRRPSSDTAPVNTLKVSLSSCFSLRCWVDVTWFLMKNTDSLDLNLKTFLFEQVVHGNF